MGLPTGCQREDVKIYVEAAVRRIDSNGSAIKSETRISMERDMFYDLDDESTNVQRHTGEDAK